MSRQYTFSRRSLLKIGIGAGLGAGLSLGPRLLQAQAASNDRVLFFVFLRGGADGMSFVHPATGTSARRQKYEEWRVDGTRVQASIPVERGLAMHPALAPLQPLLRAREMCIVPGISGAAENRSHFEQQDLVESGANAGATPRIDGFLGRALNRLPQNTSPIGALALNSLVPYSLRFRGRSPLSIPSFATFGQLSSTVYDAHLDRGLRDRIEALYLNESGDPCAPSSLCETGMQAAEGLGAAQTLITGVTPSDGLFQGLAKVIAADTARRLKFLTLDIGGWDTHNGQGGDEKTGDNFVGALGKNIAGLAGGLRAFRDAAGAAWSRMTIVVLSEFGRTARQNGSRGTDHGVGGMAMVLGSSLRSRIMNLPYFPDNTNAEFYTTAASSFNAMPSLLDYRQVVSDILQNRFGLSRAIVESEIFPGFTFSTTAPSLFT